MTDTRAAESTEEITPEQEYEKAKADFQKEIEGYSKRSTEERASANVSIEEAERNKEVKKPEDKSAQEESERESDKGAEAKVGDEKISVPEDLRDRAVRAGMTSKEVGKYSDADQLTRIVDGLERTAELEARLKAAEANGSEEKQGEKKDPLEALKLDEFDEDTKAVLTPIIAAVRELKAEVADKAALIDGLKSQLDDSQKATKLNFVDHKVSSLGDGWDEIFGKGSAVDLPDGKEKQARQKLDKFVTFFREEAKANGESIDSNKIFDLALYAAYPDKVDEIKNKKAADLSRKRSQLVTERPRTTEGKFASREVSINMTDEERRLKSLQEIQAIFDRRD